MQLNQVLSTIKQNKATSLLVILQVALTVMIVSYAVFQTLTSLALWNQPTGLNEKQLVGIRHQVFDPNVDIQSLIDRDLEKLRQMDGIVDAVLTSEIPLDSLRDNVHSIYLDNSEEAREYQIEWFDSNEKMLSLLNAKIVEGRNFYPSEIIQGDYHQVERNFAIVMISDAFAKFAFPNESAVGKTIWLGKGQQPVKVVGVYSDWLAGEALDNYHTMIRPMTTWRADAEIYYFVQANVDVTAPMIDEITDMLYQTQGRYVSVVEALSRPKKRMYDGRGSHAFTLLGISALAMLITGLGIAGLITFSVNQRKRQIGIRRALGGTKKQIVNFFILEVSVLTAIGVVLGVVLMIGWNYLMADRTGGVGEIQWVALMTLIGCTYLVTLAASYLPSKRAAQIDPAIVTRAA